MADRLARFFASRWGIIATGAVTGVLTPLLRKSGNLPTTGICVACFERDIAAALGLHRAGVAQYVRPEIIDLVLGATIGALAFALAGGCPGRQLFLSGKGNGDAGVFVTGMIVGAGFAHNFSLAARSDAVVEGVVTVGGLSKFGMGAVVLGLVFCVVIGLTMRER